MGNGWEGAVKDTENKRDESRRESSDSCTGEPLTSALLDELISSHPLVLLQYGSAACAPCLAIHQRIALWAKAHPQVFFQYISLEENASLAAQRGVLSAPTVIACADGQEAIRKTGYFSLEEILSQLERYLEILGE